MAVTLWQQFEYYYNIDFKYLKLYLHYIIIKINIILIRDNPYKMNITNNWYIYNIYL